MKNIKNKLLTGILAGAMVLGTAGCNKDHSQYKYDGKIGEDQVTFDEQGVGPFPDNNILTVKKADGREIKYVDMWGEDLKLEYVTIIANGQITIYSIADNEVGKPIVEEAQKQFDAYMQQIKETRINQGLENLK